MSKMCVLLYCFWLYACTHSISKYIFIICRARNLWILVALLSSHIQALSRPLPPIRNRNCDSKSTILTAIIHNAITYYCYTHRHNTSKICILCVVYNNMSYTSTFAEKKHQKKGHAAVGVQKLLYASAILVSTV